MGLSAVGVMLTSLMFAGQKLANDKEGLINDFFGTNTQFLSETGDNVEGSDYAEDGKLTEGGWLRMINDSYAFCEDAVEQGAALLKNDNDCLPLGRNERKVTLFGKGSKNLFLRSGAGGAAPNEGKVVKLDEAFKKNGFEINETVWDTYVEHSSKYMTTPKNYVEAVDNGQTNDLSKICNGDSLQADILSSCDSYNDAAIVTLVRIGTEDTDPPKDQLNLNDNEKNLLKAIKNSGKFSKIIVIINSPMPMSVDWADNADYGVDAIVYMGVPGYYGAGGIARIIAGEKQVGLNENNEPIYEPVNPSGHLVTSFAANASSSAAYQNFGNNKVVVYKEGVYVGYKYYETRYEDCILEEGNANGNAGTYVNKQNWNYADEMGYPFGFGLSYTTFEQKIKDATYNKNTDEYDVKVEVTNTGSLDGKASIQIYVQEPYTQFDKANNLGKASIQLMAYDKVDVEAGKTVEKTVSFPRYFLTTYDSKVNETYILEGGDYYFAVGNGAHDALNNVLAIKAAGKQLYDHLGNPVSGNADAVKIVSITQDLNKYAKSIYNPEVEVKNQFSDADYNNLAEKNQKDTITYLDRRDWQGTWPTETTTSPASEEDLNMGTKYDPSEKEREEAGDWDTAEGKVYSVKLDETITFADMADVPLEGEVKKGKFEGQDGAELWEKFISQMSLEDLAISVSDNRGILDVLSVLKKGNSVAEGPEGLLSKFLYGDNRWATGFPTGPTYTGTWDHEMQKKFGGFYGEEAIYCGVACVNAPGANIVRCAYTSRASEYMSEDGILNYYNAANVVGEARKKGLIMNIKHCFLNNQESGRKGVETYCTEQAIREIYLKPFEGALTKGHSLGIMTSYNRIGPTYAATHKPLMQNVMRGEWNYKGQIIDDAYQGENSKYTNTAAMLYCGTDLFCLDGARGGQILNAIKNGHDMVLVRALQRANKNIMYSISRSMMGGIRVSEEEIKKSQNQPWKIAVKGIVIGTAVVTGGLFATYVVLEVLEKRKLFGARA